MRIEWATIAEDFAPSVAGGTVDIKGAGTSRIGVDYFPFNLRVLTVFRLIGERSEYERPHRIEMSLVDPITGSEEATASFEMPPVSLPPAGDVGEAWEEGWFGAVEHSIRVNQTGVIGITIAVTGTEPYLMRLLVGDAAAFRRWGGYNIVPTRVIPH